MYVAECEWYRLGEVLFHCSFPGRSRDDIHRFRFPDDVSEALWVQQCRSQHVGRCSRSAMGHVDRWMDSIAARRRHPCRHRRVGTSIVLFHDTFSPSLTTIFCIVSIRKRVLYSLHTVASSWSLWRFVVLVTKWNLQQCKMIKSSCRNSVGHEKNTVRRKIDQKITYL